MSEPPTGGFNAAGTPTSQCACVELDQAGGNHASAAAPLFRLPGGDPDCRVPVHGTSPSRHRRRLERSARAPLYPQLALFSLWLVYGVCVRPAISLWLREGDREGCRLTRSSSVRAGLAQRARIVLLAADGVSNTAIADSVGVSRPTVIGWRQRYQARGMAGLDDDPRSGRPRSIDHAAIITATLQPPPEKLGVTHWSTRLLARQLDISDATVAKAWRGYRVQPWRAESFRFSTDPELVARSPTSSACI